MLLLLAIYVRFFAVVLVSHNIVSPLLLHPVVVSLLLLILVCILLFVISVFVAVLEKLP